MSKSDPESPVICISRRLLGHLHAEVEQTQRTGSQLATLTKNLVSATKHQASLEKDLASCVAERDSLRQELSHWKAQVTHAQAQAQRDKQKCLSLHVDCEAIQGQLGEQSAFYSRLGATLATLLWKLSRQEDAVATMVASKTQLTELLQLTATCLASYQESYAPDAQSNQWPEADSPEARFLLALVGLFTNLCASAGGREQLASLAGGRSVAESALAFLATPPSPQTHDVKSLLLSGLYNLSINQKGFKTLTSLPFLLPTLAQVIQGSSQSHQAAVLKLLQSLVADDNPASLVSLLAGLNEALPSNTLESLASGSAGSEVKQLALELMADLRHIHSEP